MFELEDDVASGREKCYTTIAQLPSFIDPKQTPTKGSPFSTIWNHPFVHTVEVTLPRDVYATIESSLDSKLQKLSYGRLSMTLSSVVEGDFFNTYIKAGNILMISGGRSGLDNVYTLRDGVLRLELGKEDFERTGLEGKAVRTGGKKHAKERYLVELNLRLPSMLHGKKGFQRIEWAFKNVLTQRVAWLFFDLGTESAGVSEDDLSLRGNSPEIISCEPIRTTHENISTPSFSDLQVSEKASEEMENLCGEISEWLSLVSLESQRVSADDDIDPYLCRYDAPEIGQTKESDLVTLKWHGFIPPRWIMQLFITFFRETAPRIVGPQTWFALSASALGKDAIEGKDGYSIMALPPLRYAGAETSNQADQNGGAKDARYSICWEFVGASVL
ncbi:ribonuclease P 40kDa subunit-domain-containing protein [Aspergillus pseudodeflectus]|uniref:Ribonuclease P 40kDa subunit-domain-containing protein n=1 Tax=Aspergillus pseudodeflectus TaxID=176178 RepID=A0ABR4KI47_9EURO